MQKVSCIICAYNEAPRIGAVLSAVVGHQLLSEIIVVDDGSNDRTTNVVQTFPGVLLIRLEKNIGKSGAVATGIDAARGDLLLFLDADLQNLTKEKITSLVTPVLSRHTDVSIAVTRIRGWPVSHTVVPAPLSGQRVIRRNVLAGVTSRMRLLPRFGIEVFMNDLILKYKLRTVAINWKSVFSPSKVEKLGWTGHRANVVMAFDILRTSHPAAMLAHSYHFSPIRPDIVWSRFVRKISEEMQLLRVNDR